MCVCVCACVDIKRYDYGLHASMITIQMMLQMYVLVEMLPPQPQNVFHPQL